MTLLAVFALADNTSNPFLTNGIEARTIPVHQ